MDDDDIQCNPMSGHEMWAGGLYGLACLMIMLGMLFPALCVIILATIVAVS